MNRDGTGVVIRIIDSGEGMTQEVQQKIFDPFFTTKEVGEGVGMGLSISFAIINTLGGKISCKSSPGNWTEFLIKLPMERRRQRSAS